MRSGRDARALWTAAIVVSGLVLARSIVFAVYEHAHFDSDQAIVGLMGKHLAEGRAFPLFFYGQTYMLGVEAWLAAPWFALAGASVATLRASLILTNVTVAVLLAILLQRSAGLRPAHAVAATCFFTLAPPFTSAQLVEAQGGNIEPFLYVALLWWLRQRPWACGAVLAVGVLNREFTAYAVPVLMAWQAVTRELAGRDAIRHWLVVAIAFVLVRESVHALLPLADLLGPGTRGELVGGYAGSQIANLVERVTVSPAELPSRVWAFVTRSFPTMLGGAVVDAGFATQGRGWLGVLMAAGAAAALGRVAWLLRAARASAPWQAPAFAWYLLGVGIIAGAAYVASRPAGALVSRYFLLAIYAPVGLSAAWLALEPSQRVRGAVLAALCVWSAASLVDHARYASAFVSGRVPNDMRAVADALVGDGVTTARAGYWAAYELTFLTGERVRVASTDFVRITEYQRLAERAGAVPVVTDRPCEAGRPIGRWFVCPD
jgi:hypothetical protein